jgi:hypothetical protein
MMRFVLVLLLSGGLLAAAEEPKPATADFEDAKVGEVPKGWTVAKTGTDEGSIWKVVEDKTAPQGAKALAQVAVSPRVLFNLCVLDASSFKDVEVTVAFKAVKGEDDLGGGVVWRYKDANNYYVARVNPLEKNYRLYKIENGKRSQLATTKDDVEAAVGKWHTLTVTMKGDAITCSLNGKKYIEAKDATFADAGKVGLWTKADAHTYFDDFRATAK